MKKVLIINAHQYYPQIAEGKLTQIYIDAAKAFFESQGFEVLYTAIDKGYEVEEELAKFSQADALFFQYPVYWMGLPWLAKKYIDEVFSAGAQRVTYESDGRSRDDASKKYGSGGLLKGKSYMLSMTYNCPQSEFDNKEGFFDGLSLDEANVAVHKTFQFCGMEALKSYAVHDIFKGDLDIEGELKKFQQTLEKNFM